MKTIALLIGISLAHPALAAAPVSGRWLTAEHDSIIQIGQCGASVCGRVAKVLKMMPNGRVPIDANNPDPKLRGRPVEGMTILTGFTDNGSNWTGRIYDPKSGKSYKSKLARNPDGTLDVQGCVAFFCRSFTWQPAK